MSVWIDFIDSLSNPQMSFTECKDGDIKRLTVFMLEIQLKMNERVSHVLAVKQTDTPFKCKSPLQSHGVVMYKILKFKCERQSQSQFSCVCANKIST